MIRDAKGRKWFMRFRQYREGWHWSALNKDGGGGVDAGECFPTKALAEEDARSYIQSRDNVAYAQEYMRRLCMRGTECRLTAEDIEAIDRAANS
jgi:hypothetical protein